VTIHAKSKRSANPKSLHERALGLLAVRARSRRELERRLLRAGFDRAEVDDELTRLEDVGLIDDEAFARQLVEHQAGARLAGDRAIRSALAQKGVSPGVADAILEELGDDETRAAELATARVGRLRGLDPATAFSRLSSFLMRRGYAPNVARPAARRALDLVDQD
jgi:regulatory protein